MITATPSTSEVPGRSNGPGTGVPIPAPPDGGTKRETEIKRGFEGGLENIDAQKREITHWITTEAPDQLRTIIKATGIDLTLYNTNRIVLWQHKRDQPTVAKNLWIKRSKAKAGLIASTKFADTQLGRELWLLYSEGFLKGWSIGATAEPNAYVTNKGVTVITRCLLREYSACNLPVNLDTLEPLSVEKMLGSIESPELVQILRGYTDKPENGEETPGARRASTERERLIVPLGGCAAPESPSTSSAPRTEYLIAPQPPPATEPNPTQEVPHTSSPSGTEYLTPTEPPPAPIQRAELPPLIGRPLPPLVGRTRAQVAVAVLRSLNGGTLATVACVATREALDRLKGRV